MNDKRSINRNNGLSGSDHDVVDPLVAYLDGELDDAACADIEARLASDAELRQRLKSLELVWDCLDSVPRTEVSEQFTKSTVEMIAINASEDLVKEQEKLPVRQRVQKILLGAALVVACFIGFGFSTLFVTNENDMLLSNLAVIENVEPYLYVGDIRFLRELDATGLFDVSNNKRAVKNLDKKSFVIELVQMTRSEARERVAGYNPSQVSTLDEQFRRYTGLNSTDQQRIGKLHKDLLSDSESEKLLVVMSNYHDWWMRLTPGQRAEFPADPKKRIKSIEHKYWKSYRLPQQDCQVVLDWVRGIIISHQTEIIEKVSSKNKERIRRLFHEIDSSRRRYSLVYNTMPYSRRGYLRKEDANTVRKYIFKQLVLTKSLDELKEKVSEKSKQQLTNSIKNRGEKKLINRWIRFSLYQMSGAQSRERHVGPEELEKFFESDKISNDQRQELLGLSPEEMQRRLKAIYRAKYGNLNKRKNSMHKGDFQRELMHDRPKGPPRNRKPPWGHADSSEKKHPSKGHRFHPQRGDRSNSKQ